MEDRYYCYCYHYRRAGRQAEVKAQSYFKHEQHEMRRRAKARPERGGKLVGEARNQKDCTSQQFRFEVTTLLPPKKLRLQGLTFMVKAMLGKTQQGKKEARATSQAERKAKAILDTGMQAIKETSSMK